MIRCNAIALAGLALALAILSPASAQASAGDCERDRPVREIRGRVSGTVSLTILTAPSAAFAGDVSGVGTHLGEFTGHAEGSGAFTSLGTFYADGTTTLVADNGDTLSGLAVFQTSPFTPAEPAHTTRHELTITGGTGRFECARGALVANYHVTPLKPFDPLTMTQVNQVEGAVTGHVSY
jgi:hypothetical protein